jgi:predicted naringenin-chalcone synthase
MELPRIAAVATATPARRFTQAELLQMAGYRDERRRGFFEASDIGGRHLYIDPVSFRSDESVDELNDRFRRGALELGEAALRSALDRAGWRPEDVDFLATTTCTGRMTPSLDAHLVARLGCRRDVQRVHVGDTGCAAAVVALQQACNHIRAFPGHRALVLAVEICSAAYFLDDRLESAVAHAIFADGAGALALSGGGSGPAIVEHRTMFRSEHLDAMGFEYPGGRPRVVLSKDVRRIGATMMAEMGCTLLESQGLKRADVRHWVLHSAGRRVLDRARVLLDLDESALAPARGVLRDYGNMSSATILFVLESVLRQTAPDPGEWGVMIGLGPGFAAEGALLRW